MIRLPISQQQLVILFRLALMVVFVSVTWLALTRHPMHAATLLNDKVNHCMAFFVLAFCVDNAFPRLRFLIYKFWPLVAYGYAIEWLQSKVHRDYSLWDLLADSVGVTLYWLLRRYMRRLVVGRSSDNGNSVEQGG